jgi:hypothetical protein
LKLISKIALAGASLAAFVTPAAAAVLITSGSTGQGETVQLNVDEVPDDNVVRGTTNQTNGILRFTGANDEVLVSTPQGQARIDTQDGTFTFLQINPEGNLGFSAIEFNIDSDANGFVQFSFLTTGSEGPQTRTLSANGSNFFRFETTEGELITQLSINTLNVANPNTGALVTTQIGDVGQFRVNLSAVPEPTTWAMMLIGFGAVGCSMRARKSSSLTHQAV